MYIRTRNDPTMTIKIFPLLQRFSFIWRRFIRRYLFLYYTYTILYLFYNVNDLLD